MIYLEDSLINEKRIVVRQPEQMHLQRLLRIQRQQLILLQLVETERKKDKKYVMTATQPMVIIVLNANFK